MNASDNVLLDFHSEWSPKQDIFLLGPGGVGKSTLAAPLADQLGIGLVDLDLEFCEQIDTIGKFISQNGYKKYRAVNLNLAYALVKKSKVPTVFVTSSGFLVEEPHTHDKRKATELVARGFGIVLLPSLDVEAAAPLIVSRQLRRGFGLQRETEDEKFRARFEIYRQEGDALVVSDATPSVIVNRLARRLIEGATSPSHRAQKSD